MNWDNSDPLIAAKEKQNSGSNPRRSVFVSASAGSGKTKVLGDRVLRLLLEAKVDPWRILCLTYTKAAAAEMSTRISAILAHWAAIGPEELKGQISDLLGEDKINDKILAHARQLFARVLDTPGGMRIYTIHAFCQSLLRRFPLEANIAPHFELIEERDAMELMDQARADVLALAHSGKRSDLEEALAEIAQKMSEGRVSALLNDFLRERTRIADLAAMSGGIDAIISALAISLGLGKNDNKENLFTKICDAKNFACDDLKKAATILCQGGKNDVKYGKSIADWLSANKEERKGRFEDYRSAFFTSEGEIRTKLVSESSKKAMPGIEDILQKEAERLQRAQEKLKSAENLEGTRAILAIGLEVFTRYRDLKKNQALLDYDDLIRAACDLLRRPGIAPWVLYKLDGGIDHVLIDEAQDTSPDQWQLIVDLTAEFFSGMSAAEKTRTLFAVGDLKQSIFSFQGANPEMFGEWQSKLNTLAPNHFQEVALDISFRSSAAILEIVDRVFNGDAGIGVKVTEEAIHHRCSKGNDFGEVQLWPLAVPIETKASRPWAIPEIIDEAGTPASRLAERMAEEIQALIGKAVVSQSKGPRLVTAGDILVLVRNRDAFFELLVRKLKDRNIPVAGIDQIHVLDQIAIMDLLAFADFLLFPEDDLVLATLLRSPLLGISEEELFTLSVERPGYLWRQLLEMAETHEWAEKASAFLSGYLVKKDRMSPYELFADLLGKGRGRYRLYSRLGPQCGEAIDEFLGLALRYTRHNLPTLQGFVDWVRSGDSVVKRDLQEAAGQLRIMTVHGSKGLQAPIVFLCDKRRQPPAPKGLFWVEGKDKNYSLPLWSPNREVDSAKATECRQRQKRRELEEENRLLYVAMTRAEQRLYVCGWSGNKTIYEKSWHDRIEEALLSLQEAGREVTTIDFPAGEGWKGEARRFHYGTIANPKEESSQKSSSVEKPTWLFEDVQVMEKQAKGLSPSRLKIIDPASLSPLGTSDGWRFKRGRLIHHLLELLPNLEEAKQEMAARLFLERPTHGLTPEKIDEIIEATFGVLKAPAFSRLFGKESLAEVPIVAEWQDKEGQNRIMSGQIDRLWVGDNEVWIVDFKSNRPAPKSKEEVPTDYIRQLSAYTLGLRSLYSERVIRCFLLWSDGPYLMEIKADMNILHN